MEGNEETIEEVAKRLIPAITRSTAFGSKFQWEPKKERARFVQGAKFQAERSFNNDEVKTIAKFAFNAGRRKELDALSNGFSFDQWFEQFKKK